MATETDREATLVPDRPKLVGARVPRTEDPRLLCGQGNYVDDIQAVGMLHVAFRRSDQAHADIVSVDVQAQAAE